MRRLLAAAALTAAAAAGQSRVVVTTVSPEVIQQRLGQVTRKLADRKAAIEQLFQSVGCKDDRFSELPVGGSKAPDLICTLAGDTDREIVVGGHFDSIEKGMGAVDDWSGAVLLPSMYQTLKDTPRRHRFVFVGFAGEELGLLGSREFVKKRSHDDLRRIHAMINLECLGLGPPEVWISRADPRLADAYAMVAATLHIPPHAMNVDGVGDDDSHPFLNAGIPVLTIHSLTRDTLRLLHSPRDILPAIHPDDYYTSYRLIAAYLAYLDTAVD